MGSKSPEYCFNDSGSCDRDSFPCNGSARARKFEEFLKRLTSASKKTNYEDEIVATVAMISDDLELRTPLQLNFLTEFDENKHTIDHVARKYLEQASKSVQHLIPIKTSPDGNCLFHSIVSLISNPMISIVEMRVRTVVELVKHKDYHVNQYSHLVGAFDKALQRVCNAGSFCELHEIVALTNVLQCQIQSVYPYLDYRAEMKIMNAVYKPLSQSACTERLIIFWTNTQDEFLVRNRPGCRGVWSPNHFVPLISPNRLSRLNPTDEVTVIPQTPRKTTTKNNQPTTIRSPEFSPPSNNRKQKTSVVRSLCLNDEFQPQSNTYDAQRKKQQRAREDEQQRSVRLLNDRLQKQLERDNETEEERDARLSSKRIHTQMTRENETEEERNARLSNDRLHKEATRKNQNEDEYRSRLAQQRKRTAEYRSSSGKQRRTMHNIYGDTHFETGESNSTQISVRNSSSRRRMSQGDHSTILNQYTWPSAVPKNLKEHCLEEFSRHMSMSFLRQSICIICNSRLNFSAMKEYLLEDIANLDHLSCHQDISNLISESRRVLQEINSF